MKYMYGGAMLFAGWLWCYLFVRQFLFNFMVAFPIIKKMRNTQEDLIVKNANRYTNISVIVCVIISAIIIGLILWLCPLYLIICFFAGGIVCFVMLVGKMTPKNREMFDNFCGAYYQFVPDDELRTAMYNKKPSQMKLRLHDMGLSIDFIPEFK